jgi:hypothetical protein
VGALTIRAGRVTAEVHGSRPDPYDVLLEVRCLRPDEWECVLDVVAARAGHAAALLDGELHEGIVAEASAVDVELLPRSGELRTACSCPDWAEPCKHAAAVCYLVADALDDDPFLLLELRGLRRDAVLASVRQRRAGAAEAGPMAVAGAGVPAAEAWAAHPGPLPSVPAPSRHGSSRPAPWPSDPPRAAPFDAAGLERLALDAARRAWAIRAGSGTSGLDLDEPADLARRVRSASAAERRELSARTGRTEAELELEASAWEVAGPEGLRVLAEPAWPAPVTDMAAVRDRLVAGGVAPRSIRVRANRVTIGGDRQLRRGRDGSWSTFQRRSGRWTMTAVGGVDDLVDDLLDPSGGEREGIRPGGPRLHQRVDLPHDPLLAHRAGGAERLREQADPELLDEPAQLRHLRAGPPGLQPFERLLRERHPCHQGPVPVGVPHQLVEPPVDRLEVAGRWASRSYPVAVTKPACTSRATWTWMSVRAGWSAAAVCSSRRRSMLRAWR